MPEITPEQREAAWQAIRKWTAAIGSGPQDPDYALDALIAEDWGPVTDAEARGYRAGLDAAAKEAEMWKCCNCGGAFHPDDNCSCSRPDWDGPLSGEEIAARIRALADKPKEDHHG